MEPSDLFPLLRMFCIQGYARLTLSHHLSFSSAITFSERPSLTTQAFSLPLPCLFRHCLPYKLAVIYYILFPPTTGFPSGSTGKECACNAGDLGSIPGLGKIPWRRERLPPVFWPGEFHGLYSPWGRKELETTEQLSLSLHFHVCNIGL